MCAKPNNKRQKTDEEPKKKSNEEKKIDKEREEKDAENVGEKIDKNEVEVQVKTKAEVESEFDTYSDFESIKSEEDVFSLQKLIDEGKETTVEKIEGEIIYLQERNLKNEENQKKVIKAIIQEKESKIELEVTFWNKDAEKLLESNPKIGDTYLFEEVKLKKISENQEKYKITKESMELKVSTKTKITKLKDMEHLNLIYIKLKDLNSESKNKFVNVKGVISKITKQKYETSSKTEVELFQKGQKIKIEFWNQNEDECQNLEKKDKVYLIGAFVKEYYDQIFLVFEQFSSIMKL